MTRSLWKGPFVDASLLKQTKKKKTAAEAAEQRFAECFTQTATKQDTLFVWSRRSCILPQFLGDFVQVYNGRSFVGLKITEEMVGHKFGEFASTRKTSSLRRDNNTKGQSNKKR